MKAKTSAKKVEAVPTYEITPLGRYAFKITFGRKKWIFTDAKRSIVVNGVEQAAKNESQKAFQPCRVVMLSSHGGVLWERMFEAGRKVQAKKAA